MDQRDDRDEERSESEGEQVLCQYIVLAFNSNTVGLQRQLGKSKSLTILKLGKYNAILPILIY